MKVLFTGATGVIGRRAVPLLVAAGHRVHAVVRGGSDPEPLRRAGATPVVVDLFDPADVDRAVAGMEAVFHFATSIPPQAKMPKRRAWDANDRLRTEATAHLVDAAIRHHLARFVQESITFFYADGADRRLDENAPIDPVWDILDSALDAEGHVARFTEAGGTGVVLRLAALYGPGDTSAEHVAAVAHRKLPIVGSGANYVSRLHVDDAAAAVAAAIGVPAGTYNVAEDEPATSAADLTALADALGVRRPRRIPAWLAKAAVGPAARLLTVSHRVANDRFKSAASWHPFYPSAIEGWRSVVEADVAA